MQNSKSILDKIKRYKNQKYESAKINCRYGELHYSLILITKDIISDPKILRLLSIWRKRNEKWFPTQFKITYKRTRSWLDMGVIHKVDRLLFMIRVGEHYIGHVGLFRFDFKRNMCEIDNILRGRKEYPGIIESAIEHMMNWGKLRFQLSKYSLQTSSDNDKAIDLYTKLGFKETKRVPLLYNKTNDGGEWVNAPRNYGKKIKRYDLFMSQ